ncbi:DUF4145 domain-containing protein [Acidovorax sp. 22279]|uniref:DUF4145 domain-containing protein n=1 Tax=Acidovorax sp. 22279 TaxID=3453900 RepID=UPI003F82560F
MDRKTLKLPFSEDRMPDWACPTCEKGVLQIAKDSFKKDERLHSRDHSHEAWDPDWIEYVYSCLLQCSNDKCRETVCSAGTGTVDTFQYEDEQGRWAQEYVDVFRPKFFEPHLKLIEIPSKCPKQIVDPLNESFKLYFSAPGAASNSVRVAIEELLTELKVKRFDIVKKKRRMISLHQRISLLPAKHVELKEMLTAIKWIGNAGSHGGERITHDDVLDAFELTEHVLGEIYSPKAKLAALAKKVNKKKGPAK